MADLQINFEQLTFNHCQGMAINPTVYRGLYALKPLTRQGFPMKPCMTIPTSITGHLIKPRRFVRWNISSTKNSKKIPGQKKTRIP